MKEFTYIIKDELGLHAGPAGLLVKLAKKFESIIELRKGDKSIQASQLLMLMGLGVKKGEEVSILIEGTDEDMACEELKAFFEKNL